MASVVASLNAWARQEWLRRKLESRRCNSLRPRFPRLNTLNASTVRSSAVLTKLEKPGQPQIERIQRIADVGVSSDGGVQFEDAGADAGEPATDTIRAEAGHVAKDVFSGEQGKRPAGLQRDDAAELEVAQQNCGPAHSP